MSARIWVSVPALAFRVRWSATASTELDRLEHTLWRLLALRPRTLDELVGLVGVEEDLVLSALDELADRGLTRAPQSAAGAWASDAQPDGTPGAKLQSGWVVVTNLDRVAVIPRVWVPNELPAAVTRDDVVRCPGDAPIPETREVERQIARALARGEVFAVDGTVTSEAWREDRGPPRVSLLRRDPLGPDGGGLRPRRTEAWVAVDLLPTLAGPPVQVHHAPDLLPSRLPDLPVRADLADLLRRKHPDAQRVVDARASAVATDGSAVLRALNLTAEDLDAEVARHRRERAARRGQAWPAVWPAAWEDAAARVDNAQRWLILWRLDARQAWVVRSAQAAAVERVCQTLWAEVRAPLADWAAEWLPRIAHKPTKAEWRARFSEETLSGRLGRFRLETALGASRRHLAEMARSLGERSLEAILGESPGAGTALSYWLLPLAVFDESAAEQHAARISRALARDAGLFAHLDSLIDARNAIAHERAVGNDHLSRRPEDLDLRLASVTLALLD